MLIAANFPILAKVSDEEDHIWSTEENQKLVEAIYEFE